MSIYNIILKSHDGFRWIVLIMAIAVVIDFWMGLFSKRKFSPLDNRLSLFYTIIMDIQLLMGLSLYFFLSPKVDLSHIDMSDATSRFYAVEHPLTMILAIVFAHVGRSISKKESVDSKKFMKGGIWFLLALVMILSRMPW